MEMYPFVRRRMKGQNDKKERTLIGKEIRMARERRRDGKGPMIQPRKLISRPTRTCPIYNIQESQIVPGSKFSPGNSVNLWQSPNDVGRSFQLAI
eukprot:354229-Amorphochlora_amoeboformis.AAC.1